MTGRFDVQNLDRRLIDLERKQRASSAASVAALGTFTLASDGTSTTTTVTNTAVAGSSVIMFVPSNANAWSMDGTLSGITPGSGSFTVSHQASTLSRTYNYVVINPA